MTVQRRTVRAWWRGRSRLARGSLVASVAVLAALIAILVLMHSGIIAPGAGALVGSVIAVVHTVVVGIVGGIERRRELDRIVRRVEAEEEEEARGAETPIGYWSRDRDDRFD